MFCMSLWLNLNGLGNEYIFILYYIGLTVHHSSSETNTFLASDAFLDFIKRIVIQNTLNCFKKIASLSLVAPTVQQQCTNTMKRGYITSHYACQLVQGLVFKKLVESQPAIYITTQNTWYIETEFCNTTVQCGMYLLISVNEVGLQCQVRYYYLWKNQPHCHILNPRNTMELLQNSIRHPPTLVD